MDSVCKTRRKLATNSHHDSSVEDIDDLDKELDMETSLDDNECMWLSSDFTSPSTFFAEHRLSGTFRLYADDWFISWLSTLAESYLHLDSGKIDAEETVQEGLKCKGLTLLLNSPGNDAIDSSVTSSETARSSCDKSLTPLRTGLDSSSQDSDIEKTNFSVPSMNIKGWISDTEAELDHFQSGFPSPYCRSSCSSEVKLSNSSASTLDEAINGKVHLSAEPVLEAEHLKDFKADEPLFWPFEHERNWSSEETWKCFSMSPRKDITTLLGKTHSKYGCRRRLVSNSGSTAPKILESKQRNKNKKAVKNFNTVPSSLRNWKKFSAKIVPLEIEDGVTEAIYWDRNLFQDDLAWNEELPMETVLGLDEFDGHEGVDSDINVDVFFLEEAL